MIRDRDEFTEWARAIKLQALKLKALDLYQKIESRDGSEERLYEWRCDFNRTLDALAKIDSETPDFRYIP